MDTPTEVPSLPDAPETFHICSRRACGKPLHPPKDPVCWHTLDKRPYCVPCARKINFHNPGKPDLVTIPIPAHVWLIQDDSGDAERETADILEVCPDAIVKVFKEMFDTAKFHRRPDLIITDLSAIAPVIAGPSHFYGPLCSLHERFPNTPIVINSAVATCFAGAVRDDVIEHCPQAVIHLVDWSKCQPHESFLDILRKLL